MRHLRRCVNGARSIQHLYHNAIASRYNCDSNNVTQRERKDDSIAWSESTKQRQNSIVVGFKKIEAKTSLFSYYCAPVGPYKMQGKWETIDAMLEFDLQHISSGI